MFLVLLYIFTIKMDEYNDALDWKKAFKKFLNRQEQSTEDESSSLRETVRGPNSNSSFIPDEEKIKKSISSTSLLLITSHRNDYEFSKDGVSKSKSVSNLTAKNISVHVHGPQVTSSSTKVKRDFPSSSKDVQVPEWNKVFKRILGNNSSVPDIREQKNTHYAVKKQENLQTLETLQKRENLQKHNASVNTRYTSRKLQEVPKSKVDPEEEKIREIFALSRLFKPVYHDDINEFEGAGVDIFKCDKKTFSTSCIKTTVNNAESTDDESSEQDSESFVPLKGFVANIKPYTTADLVASPIVQITEELWDDDFSIYDKYHKST